MGSSRDARQASDEVSCTRRDDAKVAELVDAPGSGSGEHYARGGSSPPFRTHPFVAPRLMRVIAGLSIALAIAAGACADPGDEALDRITRGAERLIAIAEQRARGELDPPQTNAALAAWERTDGAAIEALVAEHARALGKASREVLAERWRHVSERLRERLSAIGADSRSD